MIELIANLFRHYLGPPETCINLLLLHRRRTVLPPRGET